MLGSDGVSLIDPTPYLVFLAQQISDLIAFFESRHRRTTGEVTLDGPAILTTQQTPPPLNWGTPNTSGILYTYFSVSLYHCLFCVF